MADSLKTLYQEKVVPKLTEQFGYHQSPPDSEAGQSYR